jgi:hypothetical protein
MYCYKRRSGFQQLTLGYVNNTVLSSTIYLRMQRLNLFRVHNLGTTNVTLQSTLTLFHLADKPAPSSALRIGRRIHWLDFILLIGVRLVE